MNDEWTKEAWARAVYAIKVWFHKNNIPTEGIRLTVHLPDTNTQIKTQIAFKEGTYKKQSYSINLPISGNTASLPPDTIEVLGVKITFINPEKYDVYESWGR